MTEQWCLTADNILKKEEMNMTRPYLGNPKYTMKSFKSIILLSRKGLVRIFLSILTFWKKLSMLPRLPRMISFWKLDLVLEL